MSKTGNKVARVAAAAVAVAKNKRVDGAALSEARKGINSFVRWTSTLQGLDEHLAKAIDCLDQVATLEVEHEQLTAEVRELRSSAIQSRNDASTAREAMESIKKECSEAERVARAELENFRGQLASQKSGLENQLASLQENHDKAMAKLALELKVEQDALAKAKAARAEFMNKMAQGVSDDG